MSVHFDVLLIGFGILSALIWVEQIILYAALYSLYKKFIPLKRREKFNEAVSQAL